MGPPGGMFDARVLAGTACLVMRTGQTQVDKGHDDNEDVEPVPAVLHKRAEPVGEGVGEQLQREDGGEEVVDAADEVLEASEAVALVLRVHHAQDEVLRTAAAGVGSAAALDARGAGRALTAMMRKAMKFWKWDEWNTLPTCVCVWLKRVWECKRLYAALEQRVRVTTVSWQASLLSACR